MAALLTYAKMPGTHPAASPAGLSLPLGFRVETVARIPEARELAALPNGDLLVGTSGSDVYIVAQADGDTPATPEVFATLPDSHAAGVAFAAAGSLVYIGTEHGVYAADYRRGQRRATGMRLLARVRTGPSAPGSDGGGHVTTSVAYAGGTLYASVGSSCNACTELDPTRAAILIIPGSGGVPVKRATRIRNAIALAVNPDTQSLWAGDAGQDRLPAGHPYEFVDNVTSHPAVADYGWPECEEDHHAYAAGANCSGTVAPLIELPAYSTIIGAAFYPARQAGRYAFPAAYRAALFVTAHGSWHRTWWGTFAAEPLVASIAMDGDRPQRPVKWSDPRAQWQTFIGGFQASGHERIGRPTGIAVGTQGSLFVADDMAGVVYRVRPRP